MEQEIKTYNDLLLSLQKLTQEQLQQKCSILIEDNSIAKDVSTIFAIAEDIYINQDDDEDGGTLQELKEIHGEDFKEEDYILCTPIGRVFLYSE